MQLCCFAKLAAFLVVHGIVWCSAMVILVPHMCNVNLHFIRYLASIGYVP